MANQHRPALHRPSVAHHPADGIHQQGALGHLNPLVQRGNVVRRADRHRRLGDHGAGVGARVDEEHGAAGHLHPVGKGVPDRVHAREGGQQRGVGVDEPPREPAQEVLAHQLHEPGRDDQVRLVVRASPGEGTVPRGPAGMVGEPAGEGGHASTVRSREPFDPGAVRPPNSGIYAAGTVHRRDD